MSLKGPDAAVRRGSVRESCRPFLAASARGMSTPIVGADGRKAVKPVKVVSPLAVVAL